MTSNEYFLIAPTKCPENWPSETQALRWVEEQEAKTLISRTQTSAGKIRDLNVLESAYRVWASAKETTQGERKAHGFEEGKNYARAALTKVLGGSAVGFLPLVNGKAVCACIRRR